MTDCLKNVFLKNSKFHVHPNQTVGGARWLPADRRLRKGAECGKMSAPMQHLKIYLDGEFVNEPDAKVSVFDHGLLYGDGVFEGIRIYHGKIFKLKEHVDRLYESARAIRLEIPLSRPQMMEAIQATVDANHKKDGYIRPVVTRGAGTLGIDPNRCSDPQVIIIVDDISLYPPELYEKGMKICTASTPTCAAVSRTKPA